MIYKILCEYYCVNLVNYKLFIRENTLTGPACIVNNSGYGRFQHRIF